MMWGNAGRFARDNDAHLSPPSPPEQLEDSQELDVQEHAAYHSPPPEVMNITRRRASFGKLQTHGALPSGSNHLQVSRARNICVLQEMYKAYLKDASKMYPPAV